MAKKHERRWHVQWSNGEVSLQGCFTRKDAETELRWAMSQGAKLKQFELVPVVPKKRKAK